MTTWAPGTPRAWSQRSCGRASRNVTRSLPRRLCPTSTAYPADNVTVKAASLVVGAPTRWPVVRRDQALLLRFLSDAPDGGDRLGCGEQGQRLGNSLLSEARPLQAGGNYLCAALLTLILVKVVLGQRRRRQCGIQADSKLAAVQRGPGDPQDGLAGPDFMRQGEQPFPGQPQPLQLVGRQYRLLQGPLLATQAGRGGGERRMDGPPLRLDGRLPRALCQRWRRDGCVKPFEGSAHTLDRARAGIVGQAVGSERGRGVAVVGQVWRGVTRSGSDKEVCKGRSDGRPVVRLGYRRLYAAGGAIRDLLSK